MALNAARQASILRSATAIIAAEVHNFPRDTTGLARQSASNLYERIKELFGKEVGFSPQQARGLANQAIKQFQQGEVANQNPARPTPLGQLVTDPALTGRVEKVRYDIVVTGHAPDGSVIQFRTEVLSDRVMSRDQLEEYVRSNVEALARYRPTGSAELVTDGSQDAPTVRIITAGRRP